MLLNWLKRSLRIKGAHEGGDAASAERVNFFIVGVQKGGTTALDQILRSHPELQMARYKEVHFFDNELQNWQEPTYSFLHEQFDWSVSGVVRGEATPIYIYWPQSLERLKSYNPDARLVVCLRHPIYRAYSQWKMETKRGRESLSFGDAIRNGRDRVRNAPGGVSREFSYIERSLYRTQIERLLALFPRRQILFIRTDTLWIDPQREVSRLTAHLGVRDLKVTSKYIAPVDTTDIADTLEQDRAYLHSIFAEDITGIASLIDCDISDWVEATYQEKIKPDGI